MGCLGFWIPGVGFAVSDGPVGIWMLVKGMRLSGAVVVVEGFIIIQSIGAVVVQGIRRIRCRVVRVVMLAGV